MLENQKNLKILTFLTAFCSLFYDLVFSQLTSVFLGSTILSYSLNLGVYILALSFGSIFYNKWIPEKKKWNYLFIIEIILSLFGLFACYMEIFLYQLTDSWPVFFQYISFLIPVALIGILSGFELPLLIKEGPTLQEKFYILSTDFIGMFCATLLFPILFFYLGIIKSSLIVSFFNLIIAYNIILLSNKDKSLLKKMTVFFFMLIFLILFIFDSQLEPWRNYFFTGEFI